MEYRVAINEFEGPLDLLLHLVKQMDISIYDISIEVITKQYLDYINKMEELNLNVASEYLVLAAELIEMKSNMLLPKHNEEEGDDYEEDPREQLINRLLEYERYKEVTSIFKEYESKRCELYSKSPSDLGEYTNIVEDIEDTFGVDELVDAFKKLLERKEFDKPLNTKVTNREYSVSQRSNEIRDILKEKKQVLFEDLFDFYARDYIVVTFLSILDLAKKNELCINQDSNFNKIFLEATGV